MSWRETLGVSPSTETTHAHNSQNTQNPTEQGNCADIADSAHGVSKEKTSKLLETLADACRGLDITPTEVKDALAPEDVKDWETGAIGGDTPATFARSLVQRREMDLGQRPAHYAEQATCQHCGPVWLWFSGEVAGCPWCWNRATGKPIPRPCSVRCSDCIHFERVDHPHLGYCTKGASAAVAGFWDATPRYCERFVPSPQQPHNDPPRPARSIARS